MNRRSVIAGAATVVAISIPVSAQTRGPAPGASDQAGQAEAQHMQDTMRAGALALATSRIAVQKAQNPDVKKFARFEVAEQETIAESSRARM